MKKKLLTLFFVVTFFALSAVSASALSDDTVTVGLRYGSTAMFSANLENALGRGFTFGYFDDGRFFEALGWTDETAISMTAAGDIYMSGSGSYSSDGDGTYLGPWHVQIDGFRDYDEALNIAGNYGGYPAWVDWGYVVRVGCYGSESEAAEAASRLGEGYAAKSSSTGVMVTVTRTTRVLFEFDCGGVFDLAVQPEEKEGETSTWFKGYKYRGAFEYPRVTGGDLNVYNVLDLESYVKGVIPYEMNGNWPLEALKAQAVCARTYACRTSKHRAAYGFDVCNTTCCQVYYGRGSGASYATEQSDAAVEATEGERLYYNGDLVQDAGYHSSNGGATEDVANVWGKEKGYLKGKADPYESMISIPNYNWSVTYTADELTGILDQKEYNVGTVKNVYVSEYTPLGNVKKLTIQGSRDTLTVSGDTCRTIFYSSTYQKSVKSLRFSINGGGPSGASGGVVVNGSPTLDGLDGISVISGSGKISRLDGNSASVISSSGGSSVSTPGGGSAQPTSSHNGSVTITGTGSGHNVGMSQYGAKAMAENGYDYEEILKFYYTDITIG